jgi:hypothetical protein
MMSLNDEFIDESKKSGVFSSNLAREGTASASLCHSQSSQRCY